MTLGGSVTFDFMALDLSKCQVIKHDGDPVTVTTPEGDVVLENGMYVIVDENGAEWVKTEAEMGSAG
jgi:hypothetical protein